MKKKIREKARLFCMPKNLMHSPGNSLYILSGLLCTLTSFVFLLSGTAQADWVRGNSKNAWWYDLGNGNYYKSSWQWIDGNHDGIAECYCFDENGWMFENAITPDRFTVNENGAWTVDNIVQTKSANLISQNNTNNNTDAVSNTFTETKNNNLSETNNNGENQGNEDFNERRDEYCADLLRRVNKYREKKSLNTLEENDYLNEMAQTRAEELSIRMSHIRPNGELASRYGVNGEIITKGPKIPKDAFNAFYVSKQHNELMLDREFLTFGSGYYVDGNGKSYWVILFSTSPKPETQRQQ